MAKTQLNLICIALLTSGSLFMQPFLMETFFSQPVTAPTSQAQVTTKPVTQASDAENYKHSEIVQDKQAHGTMKSAPSLDTFNTGSANDLESIKGIGPVLAKRIISYRETHGAFKTIDSLGKVKGIGEKKLQQIKQQVKGDTHDS